MGRTGRVLLACVVGFSLWSPSKAAPVTYEVGGTFVGHGAPFTAPFEGEEYTFRFTYDADKVGTVFEDGNTIGSYRGGFTDFRFSSSVNGQPYEFIMPDIYPNSEDEVPQLYKFNNSPVGENNFYDNVGLASTVPSQSGIQYIGAAAEGVNGFYPTGLVLNFMSILGPEGNDGFDFLSDIGPDYDPLALASLDGYGSIADFNFEPGDGYKGILVQFIKNELDFEGDQVLVYRGLVGSEFDYIRIVEDARDVSAPSTLMVILSGLGLLGFLRRRRAFSG